MSVIILIGMMGSGKTHVGKDLADRLNWSHLDTDQLIEEKQGISIAEIFETNGEPFFRKLENELLKTFGTKTALVLSTGGGIILNQENVSLLRKMGTVVYLKASVGHLEMHVDPDDVTRPMLKKASMEDILLKRAALYESAAHMIVAVDGLDITEISEAILTKQQLFKYNK